MGEGVAPAIRFSPAAPQDLDRLVELRVRAMRPALERIDHFDPARARRRLTEQYRPQHTRLIWAGEAFAGCVAFAPHGPGRRMLEHFYLEPELSGRGIGSAVMAALMAEADAEGCAVVLTVVRESDANRLYPRFGFVETGRDAVDIFYERPPATVRRPD
jgi:GNAT superfamily N-acetyltransferase